ncbi:MAG: GWxTD domain-containing protein, partial [Acidobacteriota bacterium]
MFKKTPLLAAVAVFALIFAAGIDDALAQRGGRRGGGQRGQAAELDQQTVLDEFDKIVELIWTDEEEDAWKDLDDDDVEGKQAFIASFWESRDPTPGTADNEFEDVWMARVALAANQFRGEGRNGWETDRGKFLLIYGPEAIVAQESKQVSGSSGGALTPDSESNNRGTTTNIVWTLDPTQNPFLDDKDEITFGQFQRSYSRISGGFDYNQDAFLAGVAVSSYFEARRANPNAAGPTAAAGPGAAAGAAAGGGAAGAAMTPDRAAMQELMQSGVTHDDLQLEQRMGYIPAADGNTFAMFNFELAKEGLTFESAGAPAPADMLAFGVLFKKDPAAPNGEEYLRDIKIDFTIDPSNGSAQETSTHSFGMTIEPGDYRLSWGVMDKASEHIATTNYDFTVPDYRSTELAVPSVIIANGLEQKPDNIDINTVYDTTRVGNLALSTDMENDFGRNDSLLLLYFISGLSPDPATQQPSFEVNHRILIAGTDDSIARLPSQTLNFGGIQQEIPLA